MKLKNVNVVLGVTGGIAAYKAVEIVSRLKKQGANVYTIMTKSATEFITPLTIRSISHRDVITDMFKEPKTFDIEHISWAQLADVFVIAPATANIIGKMAYGIADDMLSTTVMATKAPVILAPAMNTGMYENKIVQDNIDKLKSYGYHFIEPDTGLLACDDIGKGKLPTPESIVDVIINMAYQNKDLKGKKVLVTAGATKEIIDPVRYITNRSTGKMGYAIAEQAALRGAEVTLVSGSDNIKVPYGVKRISIETAEEMYEAVTSRSSDMDVIIKAAAVADYRPKTVSDQKIKKADNDMKIDLTRNHDIALELGKDKTNLTLIGFSAETENLIENAKKKIIKKNFDFIVANNVTKAGAGFGTDTNIVTIIDKFGNAEELEKMSKNDVADRILDKIKK